MKPEIERVWMENFRVYGARKIWLQLTREAVEAVEFATLNWVDCFNNRRLLQPIGDVPPAEFEQSYYRQQDESAVAA